MWPLACIPAQVWEKNRSRSLFHLTILKHRHPRELRKQEGSHCPPPLYPETCLKTTVRPGLPTPGWKELPLLSMLESGYLTFSGPSSSLDHTGRPYSSKTKHSRVPDGIGRMSLLPTQLSMLLALSSRVTSGPDRDGETRLTTSNQVFFGPKEASSGHDSSRGQSTHPHKVS